MNIKRYYGKTMPEVMNQVRMELGPDAVILSNRTIRKGGLFGLFAPKTLEVMVAYENAKPAEPPFSSVRSDAINKLAEQVDALNQVMNSGLRSAARTNVPSISPVAARAYKNAAAQTDTLTDAPPKPELPSVQPPVPDRAFVPITKDAIPEVYDMRGAQQESLDTLLAGETPPEVRLPARPADTAPSQTPAALTPPRDEMPAAQAARADEAQYKLLDERIDALQELLDGFTEQLRTIGVEAYEPQVEALKQRLVESEVNAEIAHGIASAASLSNVEDKEEALRAVLTEAMGGECEPIRVKPGERTVVMIVGPTGVGKTTSLVKLAAYFAVRENLKVGLINTDTYRIAAQEQLKTYADILEIPLALAYSADEIEAVLRTQEDRDIVFIDTAGKRSSDDKHKREVGRLLEKSGANEVLLAVSAMTGEKSLRDIIDNYGFLPRYKLLVTKLDEAKTLGVIVNACKYSGKPLSYVANGQNVPDDLEKADVAALARRICG